MDQLLIVIIIISGLIIPILITSNILLQIKVNKIIRNNQLSKSEKEVLWWKTRDSIYQEIRN